MSLESIPEFHRSFDVRMNRLATESSYPEAVQRWTLADPAFACLWPELRKQIGSSVREFIEISTPAAQRFACRLDLQALRDDTILGKSDD